MRKNSLRYLLTRYLVKKDGDFLIKEGIRKALYQGLEVNIAGEIIRPREGKQGRMYIPPGEKGVDVTEFIKMAAEDYPSIARRYIENKRKLDS